MVVRLYLLQDVALVGIGLYTPYHGECMMPDGSIVTGDAVSSLDACRARPAVWAESLGADGMAAGCSDGISSNETACKDAHLQPSTDWTNGLEWVTPVWCDIIVFIAPVTCASRPCHILHHDCGCDAFVIIVQCKGTSILVCTQYLSSICSIS